MRSPCPAPLHVFPEEKSSIMSMALFRLPKAWGAAKRSLVNRSCRGRYSSTWLSRDSPLEEAAKLENGQKLHGYTIQAVTPVPDFNLVAVQLTHDTTGAEHLHIARKDTNNIFSVSFRTTPCDSTGVSHILEHTTLCGSHGFPVRDPFFKMLTRSLATFMNAFTSNDWTMYPFSTQNSTDYQNLMSVYLDCAFFPKLREMDFRQEGWRLENETTDDKNSPFVFKGVVFNEMKGVFANSESIYSTELQRKLLPSHTYSHVSGGLPENILDLTWEALKQFHSTHYHPSNSRFLTYGDLPLPAHLKQITESTLGKFSSSTPSEEVPSEPRWSQPREYHIYCPPDPMAADPNKQTTFSISFMLGSITDPYESMVASILSQLLVDGPASPFYQSLLDANIGSDYSPGTGYSSDTKDSTFSVGLQGLKEDDVDKVKDLIWSTLEKVAEEGFSEKRVKAVLHQIELGLKHQTSNFGLSVAVMLSTPWIHGADPVAMLQVNKNVEKFKEHMQSPSYLKDKIKELFLNNKHQMSLVMTPQESYKEKEKAIEEERLKKMVESLSEKEKQKIYEQGLELAADQNKPADADCLPSLTVSDVDKTARRTELELVYQDGVPVQYCQQPTNGVTYFRALMSCHELPENLLPYVPLFTSVLPMIGAGGLDHHQFAEQCDLYTGGLHVSPHISAHHTDSRLLEKGVYLSSHCLDRHLHYMLSLWEDIFTDLQLKDLDLLRTLVAMAANNMATSVADSGHMYAITASCSSLTPSSSLSNNLSGLPQVKFMKELADLSDLSEVMGKVSSIAAHVLDTGCMRCSVNMSEDSVSRTTTAVEGFLDTIPGSVTEEPVFMHESSFSPASSRTYYQLPFPVHYVAQSYRTVPYTHKDSAQLRILARLLSWKYLHREIREKGGAYGGGAKHGDGVFSFYSYRDPHSLETIDRFHDSIQWAVKGDFTDQDVQEAKLSVFSQLDSPVSPGARGSTMFLKGITDDQRQTHRDHLFAVSKDTLIDTAKRYLLDANVSSSAIIGPENPGLKSDWTVQTFTL